MHNWQAEAFWQYSLAFYRQPGVQDCCLQLQDAFGLNVNLLLLCSYLQSQRVALSQQQLQRLTAAIEPCDAALQQHRARRRQSLRGSAAYQQLLAEELTLEKQQQRALIDTLNQLSLSREEHGDNLQRYAQLQNGDTAQLGQSVARLQQLAVLHSTAPETSGLPRK